MDWLVENAKVYSKIIQTDDEDDGELEDVLFDLSNVQGVPSYLLLLNLMKRGEELEIGKSDLVEVCALLTRFFVRRNLTDMPPTRDLTRLFIRIIEEADDEGLRGSELVVGIRSRLVAVSAADAVFEEHLRGPIYHGSCKVDYAKGGGFRRTHFDPRPR